MRPKKEKGFRHLIDERHAKYARVANVIEQNIEKLQRHADELRDRRPFSQKVADVITAIAGSVPFVTLHLLWFAFWLVSNLGVFGFKPYDPFPFGLLTAIVSLEAIFLSIFVLISQNRMQEESDQRAELDLQINLLTEYELTRVLRMIDLIAKKLEIDECLDPELATLEEDTDPGNVMTEISEKHRLHDRSLGHEA